MCLIYPNTYLTCFLNTTMKRVMEKNNHTTVSEDMTWAFQQFTQKFVSEQIDIQNLSALISKKNMMQVLENSRTNVVAPEDTPLIINRMSLEAYKNATFSYEIYDCIYGAVLIASDEQGISLLLLIDEKTPIEKELKSRYPYAKYIRKKESVHQDAVEYINRGQLRNENLPLRLYGTDFQLSVWSALLNIPLGDVLTYSDIAKSIHAPKAQRAVGTAVGKNPISLLVPCHRIIKSTGEIGHYYWGRKYKLLILSVEQLYKQTLLAN